MKMSWRRKIYFDLHLSKKKLDNFNQWIANKKSFTRRINDIACLKIEVISEKKKYFLLSEKQFFSNRRPQCLYLREVVISANNTPIMYARTVLPSKYLRGYWSDIKNLNTDPLSKVVYDKPSIERSDFFYLSPMLNNTIRKKISPHGLNAKNILIGRQSHFGYKKKNILLTEFFSKDISKFDFK